MSARIPQVLLLLVVLPIPESSKASPAPQLKHSGTGVSQAYYYRKKDNSRLELGRQPANTKSAQTYPRCVHSWREHQIPCSLSRERKLFRGCYPEDWFIHYVYNASNNELVRTSTLIKSTIIQVDATLFRQWYETHYTQPITKKGKAYAPCAATCTAAPTEPVKLSKHAQPNL
ncbi:40S ribosomal protein S8 [Mycena sanguinolenta]|uniref:40S ribosomal protein S8 n=1 Tax=Mycena sanguinolenta TaxID=230812 RepID=A0A8H6WT95_9AGAR|nr:40S ribosomal protein S8 [Mycena sanguinolenta]